jgi:pyridoxal phosphate enzyme (YggS family)
VTLIKNVERVKERIEDAQQRSGNKKAVEIIAITKTHPASIIEDVIGTGLTSIGENRVQEAEVKFAKIPNFLPEVTKRLVGNLQSNKINKALKLFDTIDSVDSSKLANKIGNKTTIKGIDFPILLEVNTSGENAKFGFDLNDVDSIFACFDISGITVQGLMTVGPLTSDKTAIRKAFISLRKLHSHLNEQLPPDKKMTELSMGMSGDFEIAVEEGATMVRLGTILFGPRSVYR